MNKYKVKLMSMAKLPVGPGGVHMPLCESCLNKECGNPISFVDISIFGVVEKIKLHKSGSGFMAVINCEGYMTNKNNDDI